MREHLKTGFIELKKILVLNWKGTTSGYLIKKKTYTISSNKNLIK